jgi:transcriptional regulator with PAS, ATPase and Fis domain
MMNKQSMENSNSPSPNHGPVHAGSGGEKNVYENLLKFYVDTLPKVVGVERCSIFFVDNKAEKIWLKYGTELQERQIEVPIVGSIAGKVISSGKVIVDNHMELKEGAHQKVDKKTGFSTHNMVCVPIKSQNGKDITGAIQILNKLGDSSFAKQDILVLEEAARHLSVAVDNLILNQKISHKKSLGHAEVGAKSTSQNKKVCLVAVHPSTQQALDLAKQVSPTPANVLVMGNNGVGKETFAHFIHQSSSQKINIFEAVECGVLPEHLQEQVLFGTRKKANKDPLVSRMGILEQSIGGTLFLRDIDRLSMLVQSRLYRYLHAGAHSHETSLNDNESKQRIISSSIKDIQAEVEDGRFHEGLFFQLSTVEICLLPLKERPEDIIPLAEAFLGEVGEKYGKEIKGFSSTAKEALQKHPWSGNVRQLRKEIERFAALAIDGGEIGLEYFPKRML